MTGDDERGFRMNRVRMARFKILQMFMALACIFAIAAAALLPAQAAQAASPDQPGPYHVGWYQVSYCQPNYGIYTATIYYPARWDGLLAPKLTSGGPYPGIVASNGFCGADWNIKWVPQHLASYGYVALVFTPPNIASMDYTQWAKGFDGGISKLKSESGRLLSPIRSILNTNKFGIIGFSIGGAGVVQCAAGNPDVDAVVALAPAGSLTDPASFYPTAGNLKVPVMFQSGSNDAIVKAEWVYGLYNYVPGTTSREFIEITGANHIGYLDLWICPIAQLIEDALGGPNAVGYEAQHTIASRYFTAWFQYYLKGDAGYYTYLFGARAQSDLSGGITSAWEYSNP